MTRYIATAAIALIGAVPAFAGSPAPVAAAGSVASISCLNPSTPGGSKCLQAGEYCSHKAGYAAAYRRAGFKCKADGRLAER